MVLITSQARQSLQPNQHTTRLRAAAERFENLLVHTNSPAASEGGLERRNRMKGKYLASRCVSCEIRYEIVDDKCDKVSALLAVNGCERTCVIW